MNNLPVAYIGLTLLFSGFTAYALIQFAYAYFRMPRKETLPPLLFSCAAFIYIASDALILFYSFIVPIIDRTRFFIILREFGPLLFLIIAAYFLNQALALNAEIKKINRILLWTGIASAAAIGAVAAFSPGIFTAAANQVNPGNSPGIVYRPDTGPLPIIRNIILIAYLLYTIAVILFSKTQAKLYPVKNILIGLVILCYFAFSNLYFILFSRNQAGSGNILFPHFALGIIIFIIFIIFGGIDNFINYSAQLDIVKKEMKQILYFDTALGIPNRIGFIKDLQSELNEAEAKDGNFSLIFLDIDDLQYVNECYGESIGNTIIKMLSLRLIDYFAWAGTLYRIGGDEFVFLLKEIQSEEEAKNLAAKIVACLRNSFPVSGVSYLITASIGILQIPRDGKDTETILTNAYSIIRNAKKTKNTFEVFSPALLDGSSRKIHIVNLLRNCIERDQFTLFYQPVVDINEKLVHAECLLRCTNTDPSIGGPGIFIPLIEEAGLMKELDNMVIRKAFHDMEMRIRKSFSISVNLSTNQLVNPAYSDFLSSFARQHGIENRQIILEVTENKLIENMSAGRENLLKLRNSGFTIAIDDFGKGFSSLTYLAELPVDILKIDMVFIQSVPGDSKKEAMARHIMELAHSLELKVIAEGFELQEQFDFFKELGCDLFQGYYFSRPLPMDEFLVKYPSV